ncbi:lipoprotein 17-related variable surface protein [[Mycoplasma] testudinis]|uniref:lipoprotein 17-related variable surface protein n=1 Tax=[Mycoplasma] testudinis TaxID=33924 RepID=UPI0004817374|nr:lipoprotein 17-related variable surface protein [[Mycoplasma] testudinis]
MKKNNKNKWFVGISFAATLPIATIAAACGNSQTPETGSKSQVDLSNQDKTQIASYYNSIPKSNFVALDSDKLPSEIQTKFQVTSSSNELGSKFNSMLVNTDSIIPPLFATSKAYQFNFSVVPGSVSDSSGGLTIKMALSENRDGINVFFKTDGDATTDIAEAGIQFNIGGFANYDKVKSATQEYFTKLKKTAITSSDFSQKIPSLVTPANFSTIENFNKILSTNDKLYIPSIMNGLDFSITESKPNDAQGTVDFTITAKSQNISDLNVSATISVSNFSTTQNEITNALKSLPDDITLTSEDKDYIPENFAFMQNQDSSSLTNFIKQNSITLPESSSTTKYTLKVNVNSSDFNNSNGTINATVGILVNGSPLTSANSKTVTIKGLATPKQLVAAAKESEQNYANYVKENSNWKDDFQIFTNSKTDYDKTYQIIFNNGNLYGSYPSGGSYRSGPIYGNKNTSKQYYDSISWIERLLPTLDKNNAIISKNFNIFLNPFMTIVGTYTYYDDQGKPHNSIPIDSDTGDKFISLNFSLRNKIIDANSETFQILAKDGTLINFNFDSKSSADTENSYVMNTGLTYSTKWTDFSKTN